MTPPRLPLIPANAGTQRGPLPFQVTSDQRANRQDRWASWVPAFAGMSGVLKGGVENVRGV